MSDCSPHNLTKRGSVLVQPVGIEPTSTALQTAAMTTSAKVAYLVPRQRIELSYPTCKEGILPLNYRGINLGCYTGIEPILSLSQSNVQTTTLITPQIEFVSCATIVIDTIHPFIQGRPGLGTSLGILVQHRNLSAPTLPDRRELNPLPFTTSVLRRNLISMTFSC